MVSEEQLEFSENGSDKKGLFKVFWRECIKQWGCEPGVGNTTLWIGEAVSGGKGQAGEAGTGVRCRRVPAWVDSVHMDAVRLVPHRELRSP